MSPNLYNPTFGRRAFLTMTGVGAGAMALSACTGPAVSAAGSPNSDSSGSVLGSSASDFDGVHPATEITFWSNHPGKSQDIENKLIAEFTEKTGIKVTNVTAGSSYEEVAQKFQTAQSGDVKNLPHAVIFSDVWWFRYFINDSIIPLDGLMKKLDFDLGDYRQSLLNDYQYNGSHWAVPYARSTPLFYYNADHFKTAGLPDKAPATWQDMAEYAPKLKSANPNIQTAFMHPAASDYDSWTLQNKIWAWGGALSKDFAITCDEDPAVAALRFNADSVYKDKWAMVSSKDAGADFASGAASCTVASTGSLVGILKTAQFNVGVGFLPGGPAATDLVCPTGGAGLGIPKAITKEQQLASAMFLQFMTLPQNTAQFSTATGYMPVRISSDMGAVIAKTPQMKMALDQLPHTRAQDYARVFLPGGDREIGMASSDIITQNADPKTRLTTLKATLQGIYTKDVQPKLR